jgi:hypothetical protein
LFDCPLVAASWLLDEAVLDVGAPAGADHPDGDDWASVGCPAGACAAGAPETDAPLPIEPPPEPGVVASRCCKAFPPGGP